ncbi:MAG TPA: hypothetical protein VGK23_03715 [Methanomassiliicoccales archaeon]|jgi:hypothetical protein
MRLKFVRAVAFATWMYSLLFLLYLTFRLTLNASHVKLDDLFIDHVPFFTFLVTGIFLLAINLASLALYLAIRRYHRQQKGTISGKEADRLTSKSRRSILTPNSVSRDHSESIDLCNLNLKALIIWMFSISIWTYLTYLSLIDPPSPPYWPISMMMFVISYICMVYMLLSANDRRAFIGVIDTPD